MTSRSRCPVQIQEEMDTFPAPAGGASESKQLQQRHVPVLSERPQGSRAEPLPAWCQEISLSRKVGIRAGTRRCPHHQRPKAHPTPLHQVLSQPSTGQTQEKLLMDIYHGQITHLQKRCCYRWASPHEIMPGTL